MHLYFHKDDDDFEQTPHGRGNMLAVAFRLLSDGGTNPVCARLDTLGGCNVFVSAQGLTTAGQILNVQSI